MSRLTLVWDGMGDEGTPFAALVRSAQEDPDVASGLAIAYSEMSLEARGKLLDALDEEEEETGGALALLLGVEEHPELAARIAAALRERPWPAAVERRDAAFAWGGLDEGGVGVVRHLHGDFVDLLRVSWRGEALEAEASPVSSGADLESLRPSLGIPPDAEPVPFAHGVDTLTQVLWRARRAGAEIPTAVHAFAGLFSP